MLSSEISYLCWENPCRSCERAIVVLQLELIYFATRASPCIASKVLLRPSSESSPNVVPQRLIDAVDLETCPVSTFATSLPLFERATLHHLEGLPPLLKSVYWHKGTGKFRNLSLCQRSSQKSTPPTPKECDAVISKEAWDCQHGRYT